MAYKGTQNMPLGISLPGNVDSVASGASQVIPTVPVGTIMSFYEDTLGWGEYIYLPGVAATVINDIVEYNLLPATQATVRHSNATASNAGRPVAVATAAIVAAAYGWYQISGITIVNATAASAAGAVFGTATAGSVNSAADAGDQILNARLESAVGTPAAGKAYMSMQRPFVQGQIT